MYREVGEKKPSKPKPQIDLLPAAGNGNAAQNNLLNALPKGVGLCKTFDEVKFYWAENYNVKVAAEIGELNFEAVRAAMSGVEAVLEEFPQAGFFLKEFNILAVASVMNTKHFAGIINFNPKYFTSGKKISAEIYAGVASGFYPKNMTVFGAGAHEAGHIVEDWLINKYGLPKDVTLRTAPTRIITAAYGEVLRSSGGFKLLGELREEICTHAVKYNMGECLADTIADYKTNGEQAAALSRAAWQELKGELSKKMIAYSESALAKIPMEDFRKYGIFDEWGTIIGVKDDAPADFKEAYEHDKKIEEEWEALGID